MTYTLLGATVLFLISLSLAYPLSIDFTGALNFDPAPVTTFSDKLVYTPQAHDGPMSITVEFKIDCAHGRQFMNLMREVRLIHLRNGAYSWRLHEDLVRPNTFRLEMIVPSWNEHLLQKERMTKAEKELLQKAWSLPDLLIAASQKVVVLLRRVFDQDALDSASLIEVVFEPIENAGDFDLLLVGQKAVQILPSEPGAVGAIDLRIEL